MEYSKSPESPRRRSHVVVVIASKLSLTSKHKLHLTEILNFVSSSSSSSTSTTAGREKNGDGVIRGADRFTECIEGEDTILIMTWKRISEAHDEGPNGGRVAAAAAAAE